MSKFDSIKDKARRLIHEDAKNDAHVIRERNADRAKFVNRTSAGAVATPFDNMAPSYGSNGSSISSINENYSDGSEDRLYEAMDKQMENYMQNRKTNNAMQIPQINNTVNSKMPKEILESFSKNPPSFEEEMPILDTMGITNGHQEIRETVQPQQTQVTAKIDYELIKNIVESSVKKYMGALSKKLLSESKSNNGNNIAAVQITGDKFVMVTKNGDLYEANMVFKKNVNKK